MGRDRQGLSDTQALRHPGFRRLSRHPQAFAGSQTPRLSDTQAFAGSRGSRAPQAFAGSGAAQAFAGFQTPRVGTPGFRRLSDTQAFAGLGSDTQAFAGFKGVSDTHRVRDTHGVWDTHKLVGRSNRPAHPFL